MSEAKKVREKIVEGGDESDFEQENNKKITILSIINQKLDLLLTKFDKIETSVNTLKKTVDTLIIRQTTIDITVCELQKDNVDKAATIINTENCCTKILELIEERALSFENAIQHASEQIKEQAVRIVPSGTDTTQSTTLDNPTFAMTSAPLTPTEIITSANELLYSHYDFDSSASFTSKRPCDMSVENDEVFTSTSDSAVTKEKHERHQLVTNQQLLNKETGLSHLLAHLFSALFIEEELKVSSVDASVRGTKAFDPVRVAAIDKYLFNLYGVRYTKCRTSDPYKELLNKKCARIRTKYNKNIANY
ncbi:unnamed protein product [Didymodactylos carnosus]|uniref:BEN domain-containing protein n=1 Tax=Didymodactylos carnosus TaxID=1234261 RepID=A0A814IX23_9BILA|nr:unnamed protein product [Didymodactylos carnosus]CAF3800150.1 unnamed protein product [Didymodactylos carnosus]